VGNRATEVERSHGDGCACTRCTGTQPGNDLAITHGAYSRLRLQPRAELLRDELAALVPFGCEADAPLLDLASFTLAQVERAALVLAIEQAEVARAAEEGAEPPARLDRLAADSRAWTKLAARLLDQLGLSPTARGRLAGDLATAERTLTAKALRAQYGTEGGGVGG
jgi:hypothetical protein